MSASDYFERILAVASTIQGTLSDDGLSIVLCSHEHLMLLNLGNAPEKFEEHRTAIASFSADNPWLDVDGDTDTGVDSTYRCLIKHKPLYSYVQRTPYESLDIPTFIQHMMKACLTCRFIDDACRVETWKTEAVNCIQNRENRKRWTEESDRVRSSTQSGRTGNDITSSAAVSKEAEGSTYMLPRFNQNCVSSMFNAQNVSFTRSETRALPDFKELLSSENLVDDGDRVVGVQYPIAIGQGEGHRQTPNQFLNQSSLVSPIIARTQEEILKTIQSMRNSCLLAAGMEAEKSLPGDSGVCRKNYHDRRSTAVPDVLTCREPVEQSYHCELEPNRFGDGNLQQRGTIVSRQTLASTDIHNYRAQPFKESQTEIEKLGHRKNRNSQWSSPRRPISEGIECKSRQVLADADRGNVVPDRVSDEVLPDELNKSQLVLELCRSDQTSQSDLTSGKIVDLCISMSEQTSGQNSPGNKISKAQNDTFSVLEYIRNSFNTDMYTSTEPAATASSSQQEETQQLPCEDIQVAGVQGEKANGRHAGSKVSSSRPGLGNRTLPSASPSSQPFDAALYLENYLHLLTASASKHEQQSMTERQPQSLQPRPHLQCLGGTDLPDGSRDSGRVSALVHNMNNSECANRPTSNCGSSAFSRSRVMSSSSLLSSGHHAFSHGTSASESGYSSEQQLTCLTGMLKARPVEGALSSPRYHQKHVSDPCINHAFSDHFPSSDGLLTEAGRTDTDTKMSGRECSPTERMLAMLTYIQTLAQMPSFPDQSVFSQADVQLPQAEDSQTDNQVPDIRASLLPENSNSLIFREAVEQSWNETLMPDFTQFSAEVGDMSASGMIRPELLLVENQIRQREYDSSPDSEEVTLAENMRSLQS
ncbi:unnamed protein product [Candidula unifasciata]|uniref:Uncharacterized protein n=1 Tax=Candidula unifasciata TaxID=100452 RepID=A0A8S3Z702_9EUPU|nr:unnamed protein product [Candidula unifasciata]